MTLKTRCPLSSDKQALLHRIVRYVLVFFLPIITGIVFYKQLEIYPFGDHSLLSVDLWSQYYPMFREFARADTLAEKMYSWNGALGYNYFVQAAFYCRSVFLLPFRWLPIEQSIVYLDTVCLIRLGLSALTCLLFLEYKFKKHSPLLTALSVGYGLCAYGIAFIMQFMWTDLMVLAPLVLLGIEKLLEGRSPFLYMLALGLCIYTNFYVAFGVCIVTVFYFVAETVKRIEIDSAAPMIRRVTNWRPLGKVCVRFALASAVAGAVNAASLIPTLLGLSHTASASDSQVDFSTWYHTAAETVSALLPQTETSLEYGVPNIAAGLFLFLFVPMYFLHRGIRFRDKLATGVLLALLYAAMNFNPLDYVFNGFHFANQLPGRWTFFVSLLLVTVAAEALMRIDGIRASTVISSCVAGAALLGFAKYSELTEVKQEHFTAWLIALVAVATLMLIGIGCRCALKKCKAKEASSQEDATALKKASLKATWNVWKPRLLRVGAVGAVAAVALCMMADACINTVRVATGNRGVRTSELSQYLHATGVFDAFGPMYDSGEDTFYRVENNQGWTFNDGLLGGYKGITYYGSTMNGNVYKLMRNLGNRVYTLNISTIYNPSSHVQNGLFGVRYFIDKGKNLSRRLKGLQQAAEYEDCIVWENPTALPLAFAVNDQVTAVTLPDEVHGLEMQNTLLNSMLGNELNVFEKQPSVMEQNDGVAEYVFVCTSDQPVYIEQNFAHGKMSVKAGYHEFSVDAGAELVKYLGCFEAGTEVRVRTEVADPVSQGKDLQFYTYNEAKWIAAYEQLAQHGLRVTSFANTKVTGTVSMKNEGLLFTSIPQDGGWRVYVDGKQADTTTVCDSLLAVRVGEGEHTVTFRYRVPGIVLGVTVTSAAFLAALFFLWWCRKRAIHTTRPKSL